MRPDPRRIVTASMALVFVAAAGVQCVCAAGAGAVTTTTSPPSTTTTTPPTSTTTPAASTTTSQPPATTTTARPAPTFSVPTSPPPPVTTIPPTATSVPALQLDAVSSTFLADVEAEVGAAQQAYDLARVAQARADAAQAVANARLIQSTQDLNQLSDNQRQAAAAVVDARNKVRDFAVASYVTGGAGTPLSVLLSSGTINDYVSRAAILTAFADESATDLNDYIRARDSAAKSTLKSIDTLQKATAAKADADLTAATAAQQASTDATILADRQALLTLTSDASSSPGTDIPSLVLDAYRRAAATARLKGCQLDWWGLAGIGRVESDHGRAQHAHLYPNGDLLPRILGPALDGSNGTQAVPATLGGKYTGDPVWDHAVGPMQFIPSTWRVWGRDGNGDGVTDPNNVYDAALGSAAYLCATSLSLTTDAGLQAAYFSYNHSDAYVAEVLAYAHSYQAADATGRVPPASAEPLYALAPTTTTPPPGVTTTSSPPTTAQPGGTPVGPPGGVAPPPSSPGG